MLEEPAKLQHRLTSAVADLDASLLLGKEHSDQALRSVHGRGPGAWLQTIPTSDKLAINPGEFCLVACLRFGL